VERKKINEERMTTGRENTPTDRPTRCGAKGREKTRTKNRTGVPTAGLGEQNLKPGGKGDQLGKGSRTKLNSKNPWKNRQTAVGQSTPGGGGDRKRDPQKQLRTQTNTKKITGVRNVMS